MVNRHHRYENSSLENVFLPFHCKGHRLTWSTLEAVCRDITNNLKDATELLHNIMSINQPFSTHSTSSTTDFDDHINSHVRKRMVHPHSIHRHLCSYLVKFQLFEQ